MFVHWSRSARCPKERLGHGDEHGGSGEMAARTGTSVRLVGALGVLSILTACGSTGRNDSRPAAQSSPTPSASSTAPADSAAIAAYEGMWGDMAKAGESANWHDPGLAAHATDAALTGMTEMLEEDDKDGAILKGSPALHPKITSAEPATAPTAVLLSDCIGTQHWILYRKATGQPWDSTPGGNRAATAKIVLDQGVWKVVGFSVAGIGTC